MLANELVNTLVCECPYGHAVQMIPMPSRHVISEQGFSQADRSVSFYIKCLKHDYIVVTWIDELT